MARVFISYAREDGKPFAESLAAALQDHEVWFDRRDLTPGVSWEHEIEQGIERCDVFLAVLTRAYRRAEFARLELAYAWDRRKPLLPLHYHGDAAAGIRLGLTQWIDFSDPAATGQSLQTLREQIDLLARGGSVAARDLHAGRWDAVHAHAAARSREVVEDLVRTDLYVRRNDAEEQFRRFVESDDAALLLIGDTGAGKTTLLAQWTLELLREKHAVLLYDCSALSDTDIEEEIARDMGPLEEIETAAAQAGKKAFILFDSIGDYRGAEENGAQVLMRSIHKLAGRVHAAQLRVVVSCNAATWTRLRRGAPLTLGRSRWFHIGDEPFLRLGPFSDAERDEAYRVYRKAFDLHSELEALPPAVKERLREPALLRMTAEVYRGVKQPLLAANLGMRIYRKYFDERVTTPAAQALVDDLAAEMLRTNNSALSMLELARHERLRGELLSDDPQSSFARLLDRGVLQELPDLRAGSLIRFSHTRIGAYAIARHLAVEDRQSSLPGQAGLPVLHAIDELLAKVTQFPLAWDAAKSLLLLGGSDDALTALAASRGLEQRELAVEALIELHAEEEQRACALLQKLLDQPSEEGRRTAFKAAYNIGPAARDFFMRAAREGDPSMRDSVKDTLYLIWRNESPAGRRSVTNTFYLIWRRAPGFTNDLLRSLLAEISYLHPKKLAPLLTFALDLIIAIYMNHCEDEDVLDQTSSLVHELAVKRLRLHLVPKTLLSGVVRALTSSYGRPLLDWMMFADAAPVQEFFRLPAEQRALLSRIGDALDPVADPAASYADVTAMLRDPMPIFNGPAAMAIAVHAARDFARAEPLIRRLWDEGGAKERLWILAAFSVLHKGTPKEWIALLEELTRRYVTGHRAELLGESSRLPGGLDVLLLPLGLAYGKEGSSMPLFDELLKQALDTEDLPLASRIISALAAVGFYYPDALFDVLRPVFKMWGGLQPAEPRGLKPAAHPRREELSAALVTTLATVRTLHFDAVDHFLHAVQAPESLRRAIDTAADVALVHRYISVLGFYNNAVYLTLHYPRMRRELSTGALKRLAAAPTPYAFVTDHSLAALRMLLDAKFQLKEWTRPE
ncbi:MAG TPA: TIR domain-containing protein [Thermoanaerobaculia bacterium]